MERPTNEAARCGALGRREWELASTPFEFRSDSAGQMLPFRRLGDAIAWVEFGGSVATLQRLESLVPAGGQAAKPLLGRLQSIARQFRLVLCGMVVAYATDVQPSPDLERLCAYYRRLGFSVSRGEPRWIHYPPKPE